MEQWVKRSRAAARREHRPRAFDPRPDSELVLHRNRDESTANSRRHLRPRAQPALESERPRDGFGGCLFCRVEISCPFSK